MTPARVLSSCEPLSSGPSVAKRPKEPPHESGVNTAALRATTVCSQAQAAETHQTRLSLEGKAPEGRGQLLKAPESSFLCLKSSTMALFVCEVMNHGKVKKTLGRDAYYEDFLVEPFCYYNSALNHQPSLLSTS